MGRVPTHGAAGFVFEIQNAVGESLFTDGGSLLSRPFDWSAGPVRFRMIRETAPERAAPMPSARG